MVATLGSVLMFLGPVLAAALVIAVPVLLGFMAYDAIASWRTRKAEAALQPAVEDDWHGAAARRIQIERGIARGFVVLGGLFWGITAFAGLYSFRQTGAQEAFLVASLPLLASLVTLIIGWYWERIAAVMLVGATAGVIYWGVVAAFEAGVWAIVAIALIGPMLTAAALFWMARREYEALEFRLAHPELHLATAEVTTY